MYLFLIQKEKENQKKRNIKSRKIDKRKRKMLVLTYIITIVITLGDGTKFKGDKY